ncbi:MAG: hypothetical protein ACR2QW_03540, partial [bacterium]
MKNLRSVRNPYQGDSPVNVIEKLMRTVLLSAVLMAAIGQPAYAGVAKCFGINDGNAAPLWYMVPNSGASPLPVVNPITMDRGFNAEGGTYRATTGQAYLFECVGDNTGPCSLYEATIDFTTDTATTVNVAPNIIPGGVGAVEGSIFEITPIGTEFLYVTVGEANSVIYKFDPSDWSQVGAPVPIMGDANSITGLAFDPTTLTYYGSDDLSSGDGVSNNADIYTIDLSTGQTTFAFELADNADAEGLSFGADGKLYT